MKGTGVSRAMAVAVACVGVLLGASAGASAASCGGSGAPSPNVGSGALYGVAATSACDAWAVGYYSKHGGNRTLVERWNGKAWKVQKTPDPSTGGVNVLYGVAALSANDAWAVGYYFAGNGANQTLVEHWNGMAWKVQKSPSPPSAGGDYLDGVAAVSANDAWAVGYYYKGNNAQTLVEHWNGKAWTMEKSPDPSTSFDQLLGVAAVSASDVWAVGSYSKGPTNDQTLVERWNGKAWKVQKSPDPSTSDNELQGVAAVSGSDAWAAGAYYTTPTTTRTLVEHWNGKAWKVQKSADPSTSANSLQGVAAASGKDAWAVGDYSNGTTAGTLVERWNGKTWKVQKSPNPSGSASMPDLDSVAAASASDAWAVGYYFKGPVVRTLIEHWNGKAWSG